MDYRTWFDAGRTVLRGDELYPHAQNFPFMYPPTCALLLAGPAFFGKPAMILILTSLNTMAWILCIRFSSALMSGTACPERAHCHRLFHRYSLCLVELSSRPAESVFARTHARSLSQLASWPGNLSRRPGCARGCDQSIPVARDFLFCLSPLLDSCDFTGHRPGHLAFNSANSISRMAPDLERRSRLATRDAAL